jgi:hypothetical protein
MLFRIKEISLHNSREHWDKETSSNLFDITMDSYDGAESCELVGSFLEHQITQKHDENFGLNRDDRLGVLKAAPRQIEIIKKDLCSIFTNYGLKITIEANKKIVHFLDVTLNLSTPKYQLFTKPNNIPLYVHNKANHPLKILDNIPAAINNRPSEISSDVDQEALTKGILRNSNSKKIRTREKPGIGLVFEKIQT